MSSAESIAITVADLKARRIRVVDKDLRKFNSGIDDPVVVDATAVYDQLVAGDKPVYIYEDHPCISPPWDEFVVCYENEHGNAIVMHARVIDDDPEKGPLTWNTDGRDDVAIEWDRVKWRLAVLVYCGGFSGDGARFPTTGPMHLWSFAIYDDGEPADLHWVELVPEYDMKQWDMAHLVILGTLNFLNCANVDVVEPHRPRHEQRRLARTGVTVNVLNVYPAGSTRRGAGRRSEPLGVPLTSVRGHFAHYGACCPSHAPRGLLFGRIEGRFWIPQHARGDSSLGETEHEYKLVP